MRKASLVTTNPGGVRCIYEIEGSGQSYKPEFPEFKTAVNIFIATKNDIIANLAILNIPVSSTITPKNLRVLSDKFAEELASIPNGNLAINECDEKGGLLKIER